MYAYVWAMQLYVAKHAIGVTTEGIEALGGLVRPCVVAGARMRQRGPDGVVGVARRATTGVHRGDAGSTQLP